MKITSSAFKEGESIPQKYTCQGIDVNPPLAISGVPAGAKSLAFILDDPDVPENLRKDRMWVHWVAYDIDPSTTEIPEAAPTLGTQGKNTGGHDRYMGPCPPDREHRYFFKLYALDCALNLPEGVTKEELLKAMDGHIVAETHLMGRYDKV